MLRNAQRMSSPNDALHANDNLPVRCKPIRMTVVSIHATKQPRRPHYIEAWAEKRGLSQADLARELGADKSVVSRWYAGSSPSKQWQSALSDLFSCEDDGIFRHPDEDWMFRFLQGKTAEEIERAKIALQAMFPRKAS